MAKYCPICKFETDSEYEICPVCYQKLDGARIRLIEKPHTPPVTSFGLNLGDANAVSGGINLSDSHNVDSHDVTNNNVNVFNTVQSAPKTKEEVLVEKEHKFREIVRKAFEDGKVTLNEQFAIYKKATELGISEEKSKAIYDAEYALVGRRMKSGELSDGQCQIIQAVQVSISENNLNAIKELFPLLEQVNEDTDNGQVQFLHYMLCTFLSPKEFIESARKNRIAVDSFWRTVWLRIACEMEKERPSETLRLKFNQAIEEADGTDESLDRQYPGNAALAKCLLYLSEALNINVAVFRNLKFQAIQEQLELFRRDSQPFLSDIAKAVDSIVSSKRCPSGSRFYHHFLNPASAQSDVVAPDAGKDDLFSRLENIPKMPVIPPIPEM